MYIGSFLYLRKWAKTAFTSICFGSSKAPANVHRKYLPLGHLLLLRCDNKRPRILVCELVLLPIYTGTLLASPISYVPVRPAESVSTFSRVNSYHLFSTGISYLLKITSIISDTLIKIFINSRERGWPILPIAYKLVNWISFALAHHTEQKNNDCCHCCGRNRYFNNDLHCYTPLIPQSKGLRHPQNYYIPMPSYPKWLCTTINKLSKIFVHNYWWLKSFTLNYKPCTLIIYGHGMELDML